MPRPFLQILFIMAILPVAAVGFPTPAAATGQPAKSRETARQGQGESGYDRCLDEWISGSGAVGRPSQGQAPGAGEQAGARISMPPSGRKLDGAGDTTGGAHPVSEASLKLLTMERSHTDFKALGEQIVSLRRRVTDHPKDADLRSTLGTYLYLAGDYQGAASELKHALALKPGDAVARAQIAKVLDFIGDHGDALMQFRRAVELAPAVAEIHLAFAESLMRGGTISEGVNEFRRAIGISPTATALSGLAEALLIAG
ncbi:MAG TPA: tetratricopeptide repeat protein, partial [Candidatus Obscuribacterales bacterium]